MQGQHIFMRCWNTQGNAGTWTAAVTDGILQQDVIRNIVVPRCNMDEGLANYAMAKNPGNNVLRIYHIDEATTVISRSFWVADRVTDSRGRMGSYCISHILTDEDALRFLRDYGGAFNVNNFEKYEALVERTGADRKEPVTIDSSFNLFGNNTVDVSKSLFKELGFTKSSFIKMMSGIYYAIENDKKVAVLLPEAVRNAWAVSGDDRIEKIAYLVMGLLPDFTRNNLGIAVHWNCNVKDQLIDGMHLFFVHPDNEESLLSLHRDGVAVLDVAKDVITSDVSVNDTEYFSFLWDNLENTNAIESFWSYSKNEFAKLLRKLPNSLNAIQTIYLIYRTNASHFSDHEETLKALISAGSLFAGAGKLIPAAEQFISDAISNVGVNKDDCSNQLETVLRDIVLKDKTVTAHQTQEYDILLGRCVNGTASKETVTALSQDVLKEKRFASEHFLKFLSDNSKCSADKIKPSFAYLVKGMFEQSFLGSDRIVANSELFAKASELINKWSEEFLKKEKYDELRPFNEAYAFYLRNGGRNAQIVENAYSLLFKTAVKANIDAAQACLAVAFDEEKAIYHGKRVLDNSSDALTLFSNAFLEWFPDSDKKSREVAEDFYSRFYRLAFLNKADMIEAALKVYEKKYQESSSVPQQMKSLLDTELGVISDITEAHAIWQGKDIAIVVRAIEKLNLDNASYVPDKSRLQVLLPCMKHGADIDLFSLLFSYLTRMTPNSRMELFNLLQSEGLISDFYAFAIYSELSGNYVQELSSHVTASHDELVKILLRWAKVFCNHGAENDQIAEKFADWLKTEIDSSVLKAEADTPKVEHYALLVRNELIAIESFDDANSELILNIQHAIRSYLFGIIDGADSSDFLRAKSSAVEYMWGITREYGHESPNERNLRILCKVNSFLDNPKDVKRFTEFDNICFNADPLASSLVKYKINEALQSKKLSGKAKQRYSSLICLIDTKNELFLEQYKKNTNYEKLSDKEQVMDLLDLLKAYAVSNFRPIVLNAVRAELSEIKEDSPKAFIDEEVFSKFDSNVKWYPELASLFRRRRSRGSKIDALTILFCLVIGLIAVIAALGSMRLMTVLYVSVGMWLAVVVGLVLFIGVLAADLLL